MIDKEDLIVETTWEDISFEILGGYHLEEVIDNLKAIIEKYKEKNAKIYLEEGTGYEGEFEIRLKFVREKTPEEKREAEREKIRKETQKQVSELKEYERLKKRYGQA